MIAPLRKRPMCAQKATPARPGARSTRRRSVPQATFQAGIRPDVDDAEEENDPDETAEIRSRKEHEIGPGHSRYGTTRPNHRHARLGPRRLGLSPPRSRSKNRETGSVRLRAPPRCCSRRPRGPSCCRSSAASRRAGTCWSEPLPRPARLRGSSPGANSRTTRPGSCRTRTKSWCRPDRAPRETHRRRAQSIKR
jgi:hypothetical protein